MRTAISVLLLLCSSAFAQVNDGSLKYNYGGSISGYPLISGGQCSLPECGITFSAIAGIVWNGRLTNPSQIPMLPYLYGPHNIHFHTGPLLTGNYADGATFGPGRFHMITGDAVGLFCTAAIPCTFDGRSLGTTLTRKDLSNGAHVYQFDSELVGTYFDQTTGQLKNIQAHYHMVSGAWWNLFDPTEGNTAQQWWTSGGLDVFPAGPQGQ